MLLDYQSRTSVLLTKILALEFWRIQPKWVNASSGYEGKIDHDTAGVVIGDRTFHMNNTYEFEYDLSEEWKKFTGLPFVFACWVSNKKLENSKINILQDALEYGLNNIQQVIKEEGMNYQEFDVENYLLKSLKYKLDEKMEQGMALFLQKASNFR